MMARMHFEIQDKEKTSFFCAAGHGDKKKVKKCLEKGLEVDILDDNGKTALFLASESGHEGVVSLLLKYGANPNRKSARGATALHAASKCGNVKLLSILIQAGGDLRLHDNCCGTVDKWAEECLDERRRKRMVEYLAKIKLFAISFQVEDQSLDSRTLYSLQRWRQERCPYWNVIKGFSANEQLERLPYMCSYGYGTIYVGPGGDTGIVGTTPVVYEKSLTHDEYGCTYNNGPFVVMESMKWNETRVTVKRLHKFPPRGGYVDYIINESEYMLKLRHPTILLLMGICRTVHLDGIVLIYERISYASLFTSLYTKAENMNTYTMCEVLKQICEAVLFLHQHKLLHCYITSHAIQLVSRNYAKLSNFEYMVKSSDIEKEISRCEVTQNRYINAAYNWMSPEIMSENSPTFKSDLYSLTCVMWEIINGMPPWSGLDAADIELELLTNRNMVPVSQTIENPFHCLLEYGLSLDPDQRCVTVLQFRDILHSYLLNHDSQFTKDASSPVRTQLCSGENSAGDHFSAIANNTSVPDNIHISTSQETCEEQFPTQGIVCTDTDEEYSILDINEVINDSVSGESENEYQTAPEVPSAEMYDSLRPPAINVASSSVRDIGRQTDTDIDNDFLDASAVELDEETKIIVEDIENIAAQEHKAADLQDTKECNQQDHLEKNDLHNSPTPASADCESEASTNQISESGSKFSLKRIFSSYSSRRSSEHESPASQSQIKEHKDETGIIKKKLRKKKGSSKRKCHTAKESSDEQTSSQLPFIEDTAKKTFFQGKLERFRKSKVTDSADKWDREECKPKKPGTNKDSAIKHGIDKKFSQYKMDISGIGKLDTDSSEPSREQTVRQNIHVNMPDKSLGSEQKEYEYKPKEQAKPEEDCNPFKKYLTSEYEDIISDEIKAILAKPMTMPKLPSQYNTLGLYSRRSIENKPPSMAEALIKLYPSPSKPIHQISPVKPIGTTQVSSSSKTLPTRTTEVSSFRSSSPRKSNNLPVHSTALRMITSPLAAHNKSCSSFGSSYLSDSFDGVVKPASHHVPEKSPRSTDHIDHYAFPKSPRNVTYPGCVSSSMQSARVNDGKSLHVFGSQEGATIVPPLNLNDSDGRNKEEGNKNKPESEQPMSGPYLQTASVVSPGRNHIMRHVNSGLQNGTKQASSVVDESLGRTLVRHVSSISDYRSGVARSQPSDVTVITREGLLKPCHSLKTEEDVKLSPRDKFFGINEKFRSETSISVNQPSRQTNRPRTCQTRTTENTPSPAKLRVKSQCTGRTKFINGNGNSVRNITAAFQKKLEEHLKSQASLFSKKTSGSETSDTFLTPQHLKQQIYPPKMVQLTSVYHASEGEKPHITRTSIQLKKQEVQKQMQQKEVQTERLPVSLERQSLNRDFHEDISPICSRNVSNAQNCSFKENVDDRKSPTSTDEDVANFIKDTVNICHRDVLREFVHPDCCHLSPGSNNEYMPITTGTGSALSHQTQQMMNRNNNNSEIVGTLKKNRSSVGSCDSATVHSPRSHSSDESNISRKTDGDIEDIYFDDIIHPDLLQERHLRLQNTLALDQTPSLSTPSHQTTFDELNGKRSCSTSKTTSPIDDYRPVYDIDTPKYPQSAVSTNRFKSTRRITDINESEADDIEDQQNATESEDIIEV